MIRQKLTVFLFSILVLAVLILACGPPPEWETWQTGVLERQRAGLPTNTVEVE